MSVAALAFLAACSHAANNSGEATNASATASATSASTAAATAAPSEGATAEPSATMTTDANGGTTITSGDKSVTIGASIDPSKLGVPVYPGMSQAGQGSYQITASNGNSIATYKTDDSFDKVYQFYKSQLPSDAEQMKTPAMAMFQTKSGDDTIMVEVLSKEGGTEIMITRGNDKKQ